MADYGNSPLHLAAVLGDEDAVRKLLQDGADAAARNKFDFLPEEVTDHEEIRKLLTTRRKATMEQLQREYTKLREKFEAMEAEHTALVDRAARLEYQNSHLIRALDAVDAKQGLSPLPPPAIETDVVVVNASAFPTSYKAAKSAKPKAKKETKEQPKPKPKKTKGDKKQKKAHNKSPAKNSKKGGKATAEGYSGPLVGKVDLRVGQIVKVWEHPDSEKLWCEMIDVGDDEPRQILSGLRKYFTADQMLNRRVLVVCNVKASAMGGIPSCGFVLCATKGEGENAQVEFINPPAGAKNGERVFPESLKGSELPAPYSGAAMKKKKIMRKIVLKTADGDTGPFAALCDGETLMTSAGPCTSDTLSGAKII